ncbi:helix-turn-helix transcriptional regulator, partial [Vibrio mediterranei]|uniref:helix-turn-helix transcriptional regulator n=1 Tax=Vibrio mediterranei TaxID=689 RepID=UPI00406856AB
VLARTTSTDYTVTSFLFHTPEISIALSLSTVDRMIKDRRLPQPLRSQSGYATGWLKSTLIAWFNRQQPS